MVIVIALAILITLIALKIFIGCYEHDKAHLKWKNAFDKLTNEKNLNGMSSGYWSIWDNEVLPAYKEMTNKFKQIL